MTLSDAQLFDFNAALMEDYDDEKARADLEEHGDVFRAQLIAALYLSDLAETLADPNDPTYKSMDALKVSGWVDSLRHVAAYLRQGYYLPGGMHYEEVVRKRQLPS